MAALLVRVKEWYVQNLNKKQKLLIFVGLKNGVVHSDANHYYTIRPLPTRFHDATSIPHVLSQKPHVVFKDANVRFRSVEDCQAKVEEIKDSKSKMPKKVTRSKREVFPVGSTVFVETAVFVDRDLFELMKANFPVDTEREIIRFVLAMINAVSLSKNFINLKTEIKFIQKQVQLLYHDPSLGRPVNFVLKRLEIMKDEVAGLIRPPDIDRFLSNFCNWQRTKNPVGDREPLHWDHALILTGLDLYVRGKHGKISNQVVGKQDLLVVYPHRKCSSCCRRVSIKKRSEISHPFNPRSFPCRSGNRETGGNSPIIEYAAHVGAESRVFNMSGGFLVVKCKSFVWNVILK